MRALLREFAACTICRDAGGHFVLRRGWHGAAPGVGNPPCLQLDRREVGTRLIPESGEREAWQLRMERPQVQLDVLGVEAEGCRECPERGTAGAVRSRCRTGSRRTRRVSVGETNYLAVDAVIHGRTSMRPSATSGRKCWHSVIPASATVGARRRRAVVTRGGRRDGWRRRYTSDSRARR